ncbi:MAG: hypothetical protein K6E20_03675 [Acholeplasmatales bacterium]|nr:hypothetical protein [Acholeplasmatales bacterium]
MIIKNDAEQIIENLVESDVIIRVYDALKIGVEKDNLVIASTYAQNILNQLFLAMPKLVTLDEELKESSPKVESIKKFMEGNDKRFGVGLDLVCNYVIKNKRLWFNIQGLSINENANTIKFFENKDLEFVPTEDIVKIYNELLDALNKAFDVNSFDKIKL